MASVSAGLQKLLAIFDRASARGSKAPMILVIFAGLVLVAGVLQIAEGLIDNVVQSEPPSAESSPAPQDIEAYVESLRPEVRVGDDGTLTIDSARGRTSVRLGEDADADMQLLQRCVNEGIDRRLARLLEEKQTAPENWLSRHKDKAQLQEDFNQILETCLMDDRMLEPLPQLPGRP